MKGTPFEEMFGAALEVGLSSSLLPKDDVI
jgi:hypothetical protein